MVFFEEADVKGPQEEVPIKGWYSFLITYLNTTVTSLGWGHCHSSRSPDLSGGKLSYLQKGPRPFFPSPCASEIQKAFLSS